MDTPSLTHSPAMGPTAPEVATLPRFLDRDELRAAVLYAVWAAIVSLAHAVGVVPLPTGVGLFLGVGGVLTLVLFIGLGRLPVAEQPPRSTLVAAQSLMAIVWSTLYAWFAGGSADAAVLSVGMYLSACALAMSAMSLPALGRLMVTAALASTVAPLLRQTVLVDSSLGAIGAGLLKSLLVSLVLTVMFGAAYLAIRILAGTRAELQAQSAELLADIERITRYAERDQLTNSYNRQSILDMVAREKARADRSGESLCICLLDIDHFKGVNDQFGHLAGDRVLAAFARRVRGALRTMDTLNSGGLPVSIGMARGGPVTAGRSAFGRVGGEEFIVLLPETSLRGALRCAERVRKAVVRRPFDGLHQVTVSIGIAEYRPGETVSSLIGRADEALYGAKNAGRNRVHCATADGGPNAIVMPDIPAVS